LYENKVGDIVWRNLGYKCQIRTGHCLLLSLYCYISLFSHHYFIGVMMNMNISLVVFVSVIVGSTSLKMFQSSCPRSCKCKPSKQTTKSYGPKVFLLTKINPEYSDILYNLTHFPGPLVCRIRQVPMYWQILSKIYIYISKLKMGTLVFFVGYVSAYVWLIANY
jgi:hypothetical protein